MEEDKITFEGGYLEPEYGITFVGGCQDGNEETSWVNTKELLLMANDMDPTDPIINADNAVDFLRTLEFSVEVVHIPKLDSAGFDFEGINHYQEKLN